MKTLFKTGVIVSLIFQSSCFVTQTVYKDKQKPVVKTEEIPYETDALVKKESMAVFQFSSDDVNSDFVFENEHLRVFYNFRGKGSTTGALIFKIENKTNRNIFIDLAYSSFINNGRAANYTDFVDRTGKVLLIPDKSYLELDKFQGITEANKAEILTIIKETNEILSKSKTFQKNNSPLVFRNKITYDFLESMASPKQIDNSFWVSKLNVYSDIEFLQMSSEELKNKMIYPYNYEVSEKVTKYRTEKKNTYETVQEPVTESVIDPLKTTFLVIGIVVLILLKVAI